MCVEWKEMKNRWKDRLRKIGGDKFDGNYGKEVGELMGVLDKVRDSYWMKVLKRIVMKIFDENKGYLVSDVSDAAEVIDKDRKERARLIGLLNVLVMKQYGQMKSEMMVDMGDLAKTYAVLKIKWKIVQIYKERQKQLKIEII